jgi:hypothetical protein
MSDPARTQTSGSLPPLAGEAPGAQTKRPESASAGPKAAERPVAAIRADIERERAALQASFEALRGELDEVVDAARQRAADAGRKARVVGPVVAGAVASVAGAVLLLRRRRGTRQ